MTPPGSAVKHVKRIPSGERNLTSNPLFRPIKGKPAHWVWHSNHFQNGPLKESVFGGVERRFSKETECLQPAMLKESGWWCSTELYREAHVQRCHLTSQKDRKKKEKKERKKEERKKERKKERKERKKGFDLQNKVTFCTGVIKSHDNW